MAVHLRPPLITLFPLGLAVALSAAFADARAGAAPPDRGTLRIRAALVDRSIQVRPVPLHPLVLASARGETLRTRTDLEGRAVFATPAGRYTLASLAPAAFEGRNYRWSTTVEVVARDTVSVDLTNDNAETEAAASEASPVASADDAAAIFRDNGGSVFRVEVGLTLGSGFLADTLGGVILTNAHVVQSPDAEPSVILDAVTRVSAQVLALDSDADIAVLRVHPSRIEGRRRIPLRGGSALAPGDRVFALGFPLHQELTITSGIASSIRSGAVISDLNTNPGNSGGPMLDRSGAAIAINTFRDLSQRGEGVSGSIVVERAGPALQRAAAEASKKEPPPPDARPTVPTTHLDVGTLKTFVDGIDPKTYPEYLNVSVAGFDVSFLTPSQALLAAKRYESEIAKDRRKREARAQVPESSRYSELREFRNWSEYVGQTTTPVVTIAVAPKLSETFGSSMMSAYPAQFKFAADVRGLRLFRNDTLIAALRGGHTPLRMESVKDIADWGYYIFDPEVLRPGPAGAPPSIVISINDLKSPKSPKCFELPADLVAEMWNGFEPYYRDSRSGSAFAKATAAAARRRKPASRRDFVVHECTWDTSDEPRSGTRITK